MGWNMACEYAPNYPYAKHCKQENLGKRSIRKQESRGRSVGKGMFGCARHCRFFKLKEAD